MACASPATAVRPPPVLRDPVYHFFLETPLLQESPYTAALKIARRLWIYVDAVKFVADFLHSKGNACALLRAIVHFVYFFWVCSLLVRHWVCQLVS
jgi:hypothetical protein